MNRTPSASFSGRSAHRLRLVAPLCLGLASAASAQDTAAAEAAPAYEKEVYLLYTINNFGYTDVCG